MKSSHLVLSIFVSCLLAACSDKPAEQPVNAPLPKVSVFPAAYESIVKSSEFVGVTEPKEDVQIQARVSGYLVKQHAADGARVKAGDLLFELDKDTLEAEVAKAKAKMAADNAALDETTRNYGRGKELIGKGSISQAQMDQLLSKKLQAEAALESSKAALKTATLNLDYASIYAPTDGVLSQAAVSTGDFISPSSVLANLVLSDPIYVSFQASEREFSASRAERQEKIKSGEPTPELIAKLKFSSGNIYDKNGVFDFVDNRVDQSTGTIKIRAAFDNPDGFVLPGQHVTIVVESGESVSSLVVPQKAVQEDQAGKFLLVLNDEQIVEKRPVTIGLNQGVNVVVKEGLNEGDNVIIDGLQKVRVGGKAEGAPAQIPAAS
jgi:membrane fusion protein, multidrug efflux system